MCSVLPATEQGKSMLSHLNSEEFPKLQRSVWAQDTSLEPFRLQEIVIGALRLETTKIGYQ